MTTRALLIPLVAAGLACVPPLRAGVDIQGPVLGYFGSPAGQMLRPISGVPGAATLGPVLATDLDAVWVAPDNRTALGLRQGTIYLLRDIKDTATRLPLGQWTGAVDSLVWANDSSGAVFYSADRHVLQAAVGLPANPAIGPELDLTGLGGPLLSWRLSGNPWTLAMVVERAGTLLSRRSASRGLENSTQALYLSKAFGAPILVGGISRPGPMDFSVDAKNLYVVDLAANGLRRVSVSASESPVAMALNSPELAPSDFTDLAVAPDGLRLLLLDKKRQTACGIEISSGNTTFCAALDFSATAMRRLSGSLYLLDASGDPAAPLWFLDSDLGRSFFVPPGAVAPAGGHL